MRATKSVTSFAAVEAGERLDARQSVDLRGADEIVLRQAADSVSVINDSAVAVADAEIRMMIFGVGDVGDRVGEAHGVIEVLELPFGMNASAVGRELPGGVELFHQRLRLFQSQRRDTAFAGDAALSSQGIAHVASLRA